jgi:hypothetical protein
MMQGNYTASVGMSQETAIGLRCVSNKHDTQIPRGYVRYDPLFKITWPKLKNFEK